MITISNLLLALLVCFLTVLAVRQHIEARNKKPHPLQLRAAHHGRRKHNGR
jgi:hypothetical protein